MTTACSFSPCALSTGGCNAPRIRHASNGGRCSIGILPNVFHTRIDGHGGKFYLVPSAMSRSTVLIGATTINGILCRAARTAALYVPICHCDLGIKTWRLLWGGVPCWPCHHFSLFCPLRRLVEASVWPLIILSDFLTYQQHVCYGFETKSLPSCRKS